MRRTGLRLLMVLTGAAMLVVYLALAVVGIEVALFVWQERPPLSQFLLTLVVVTVVVGYLSYRYGTAEVVAGLDAVEIPRERAPGLYRELDDLCSAMRVRPPRLLVAEVGEPNALSLGTARRGAVVFDRRLFRLLRREELTAILAHELAHMESHDSLVQTLAYSAVRTVVGVVVLLVLPAVFVVTGVTRAFDLLAGRREALLDDPVSGTQRRVGRAVALVLVLFTLLVRAHSRRREFAADDRAAEVTGNPVALARALRRIERATEPGWGLLSPLYVHSEDDEARRLADLFSTHPDTDERVERLLERADRDGMGPKRIRIE